MKDVLPKQPKFKEEYENIAAVKTKVYLYKKACSRLAKPNKLVKGFASFLQACEAY